MLKQGPFPQEGEVVDKMNMVYSYHQFWSHKLVISQIYISIYMIFRKYVVQLWQLPQRIFTAYVPLSVIIWLQQWSRRFFASSLSSYIRIHHCATRSLHYCTMNTSVAVYPQNLWVHMYCVCWIMYVVNIWPYWCYTNVIWFDIQMYWNLVYTVIHL